MNAERSTIVWQGPSWRLRSEIIPLPDGNTVERGAVEHPGAVVLVPLYGDEAEPQILMLRQYRFAIDETILELPAGTRGWQEEWLSCAQRELREETGFRAEQFTPLGEVWPAPGLSDEVMMVYLVSGLDTDPLPPDSDEVIELQPLPLSELVSMAFDGRLKDAKSIVGILRAASHLGHL